MVRTSSETSRISGEEKKNKKDDKIPTAAASASVSKKAKATVVQKRETAKAKTPSSSTTRSSQRGGRRGVGINPSPVTHTPGNCPTKTTATTACKIRVPMTAKKVINNNNTSNRSTLFRHVPQAQQAQSLTDGVLLEPQILIENFKDDSEFQKCQALLQQRPYPPVILPWVGFGTYKLGAKAEQATFQALQQCGYRSIDTAFIYSREKTELAVGRAIQQSLDQGILQSRSQVVVTTKQWRDYHGYDRTLTCLQRSLERLQLDYIDVWLMHWPGPSWKSYKRTTANDNADHDDNEDDVWSRASKVRNSHEMAALRAETWRAMEDAYLEGRVRAIGVCNFTVDHLTTLLKSCRIVPMINQVELHPVYPQTRLLEYCRQQDIYVQAYASLGGQDTTQQDWEQLLGRGITMATDAERQDNNQEEKQMAKKLSPRHQIRMDLLHSSPVLALARAFGKTPAQVLLKWALHQNCLVIPKSSHVERMMENANVVLLNSNAADDHSPIFQLTNDQVTSLTQQVQEAAGTVGNNHNQDGDSQGRLCWRGDPLRLLNF